MGVCAVIGWPGFKHSEHIVHENGTHYWRVSNAVYVNLFKLNEAIDGKHGLSGPIVI